MEPPGLFLVGYIKKISAFPSIEIVHDKWCFDRSIGQTEYGL